MALAHICFPFLPVMKEFSWGLRYYLLLFKKSYPLVILLIIQAFATIGVVQGQEMIAVMNQEDGYLWANLTFALGSVFSGVIYFVSTYWLLFFSTIRANLYDRPDSYSDFRLKIRSADYHDFMDLYRTRIIHFYAGSLLLGPWLIILISLFVKGGSGLPFLLIFLTVSVVNASIIYGVMNRSWAPVKAIFWLCIHFNLAIEKIIFNLLRAWRFVFPRRKDFDDTISYSIEPLTTERKVHSLRQAHPLHRGGFWGLLMLSFFIWLALLLAPLRIIEAIGPLSALIWGFSFWAMVIVLLEFINKRVAFPIRFGLFGWLMFCSWVDTDAPVRLSGTLPQTPKTIVATHDFDLWLKNRHGFSDQTHDQNTGIDSIEKLLDKKEITHPGFIWINGIKYTPENPFPVVIICAEGGASRSGFWTAAILDTLRKKEKGGFDRHVFAISSVSGGSVGVLAFAASSDSLRSQRLDQFFAHDFLAPITNRLVAGGPLLWMSPWFIPGLDRAHTFENHLNQALETEILNRPSPRFQNWNPGSGEFKPLLLINAVEAETGRRALLSNRPVQLESRGQIISLNDMLENRAIDLAGAMHIGARFPVFSPAAALTDRYAARHHFVDGGYYDNVGYETALHLIKAIRKSRFSPWVRPVVFAIINSYENAQSLVESSQTIDWQQNTTRFAPDKGLHFLSEPASIIGAASHIRTANTHQHWRQLLDELELPNDKTHPASRFYTFDLKANNQEIPMNWRLSQTARKKVKERVRTAMQQLEFHPVLKAKISLGWDNSPPIPPSRIAIPVHQKVPSLPYAPQPINTPSASNPKSETAQISPAKTPGLYYFSKKRKQWILKSKADFPLANLKPLKNRKKLK